MLTWVQNHTLECSPCQEQLKMKVYIDPQLKKNNPGIDSYSEGEHPPNHTLNEKKQLWLWLELFSSTATWIGGCKLQPPTKTWAPGLIFPLISSFGQLGTKFLGHETKQKKTHGLDSDEWKGLWGVNTKSVSISISVSVSVSLSESVSPPPPAAAASSSSSSSSSSLSSVPL